MMKRILISLILVIMALGVLGIRSDLDSLRNRPVSQVNLVSLIKRVDPSVVYVEAMDWNGNLIWSGSGVIISSDGLILTARHVVDGAEIFKIILLDGREFLSDKSFLSDMTDVGLIKIDAKKLPFSHLGNSDSLRKGEEVFIIGCPFGIELRNTVTMGIISGLERDLDGFFGEKFLYQADAQSWPGNSGGPVFNMRGRIIGVLVGGYWGADGISLIIPSNICKSVINIYKAEKEFEGASSY